MAACMPCRLRQNVISRMTASWMDPEYEPILGATTLNLAVQAKFLTTKAF